MGGVGIPLREQLGHIDHAVGVPGDDHWLFFVVVLEPACACGVAFDVVDASRVFEQLCPNQCVSALALRAFVPPLLFAWLCRNVGQRDDLLGFVPVR